MPAPQVTPTGGAASLDDLNADLAALYDKTAVHEARGDNPHTVTKAQVGLGNVDNTSDAAKPISTATQTALDAKAPGYADGNRAYAWGVVDLLKRVVLGVNLSGDLLVKGLNVASLLDAAAKFRAERTVVDTKRSGYVWGVFDPQGRVAIGLSAAGRFLYQGRDVHEFFDGTLGSRVASLEGLVASGDSIVCWGDSLTEGSGSSGFAQTYYQQLSALTGRTVTALGRGSQTAEQIAARAGGRAALLTVTGNQIPSSGPVSVTSLSINLMNWAGGAWTLAGSLAGVVGILSENGSGVYTFTRSEAGDAVDCFPDTPFIPATVYPDRVQSIWMGRNNYTGQTDPVALAAINETIKESIASIVGTMTTLEKRFVILGVTSRDDASEYIGTDNFQAKRDLAQDLARMYPKQFIDIDVILRAGGDGGTADNADVANGVIPSSLRADGTHLNDDGYAIVAAAVAARIAFNDTNGW